MAKSVLTLADVIAAQQKNQLEMSSFVQKQLQSQINSESLLKDSKEIQNKTFNVLLNTSSEIKGKKTADQVEKSITSTSGDGLNSNIIKLGKTMKEVNSKIIKPSSKMSKEQTEGVTNLAEGVRTFTNVKERISDFKKDITNNFGSKNIGTTLLKSVNVGGIFDKRIEQNEFIKQQRKLGSRKAEKTLRSDFDKRNEVAKDIKKNEAVFEKLKKDTGLNENQLGKTKMGSSLLKNRENLASKFGRFDKRSQLLASDEDEDNTESGGSSSSRAKNKSGRSSSDRAKVLSPAEEEFQLEQSELQNQQLELLSQIEENTSGEGAAGEGGGAGGEGGGGILAGVGKGLGALGAGLGKLGTGIGKGIRGILVGLAEGITILGTAVMSGVGAVGLASLAGIILTIATALRIAAPAIKEFAPVLMKLAEQIGVVAKVLGEVFIEAIKSLPEIIKSIAGGIVDIIGAISDSIVNTINAVTESIERLGNIDGGNLLQVGAGLFSVAGGMAAFGTASAIAGAGNLVSNILSFGQDNPVEQLEKIAEFGPNLNQAGTGVKNLASGMKAFSGIDAKSIEALGKLPVDKIVAAASGLRTTNAVSQASSDNKMKTLPNNQAASTNVVSAPTTITKQTKNVMVKQSIRNPEGSINSYIKSRYTHAI